MNEMLKAGYNVAPNLGPVIKASRPALLYVVPVVKPTPKEPSHIARDLGTVLKVLCALVGSVLLLIVLALVGGFLFGLIGAVLGFLLAVLFIMCALGMVNDCDCHCCCDW